MKKQLVISIVLGVLASIFVALYLISLESTYKKGAQKVKVLIASKYIESGVMVDDSMVKDVAVPKDYIQPKVARSLKNLLSSDGKYVFMTVCPIEKDEQIVMTKLSKLGVDTGISSIIPTNTRSITISFNSEMISNIIKPGNKVDIVGVFDYSNKSFAEEKISITLLQNVLILSVGDSVLGSLKTSLDPKSKNEMFSSSYSGNIPVSFALSPKEAELLVLATELGEIRLSLRPMGDSSIFDTKGTKINEVSKNIKVGSSAEYDVNSKNVQKRQKEIMNILNKYQSK
ncbi:Flp pilus assembly protein CpaB [Elusimicrobiota bacterium]